MALFKKKDIKDTEEYKQQLEASKGTNIEAVNVGTKKEQPKEITLEEQIANTPDAVYKAQVLRIITECLRILKKVEDENSRN